MSTFRNPVGPQSSAVYWRRRLVVALGLVAVIVIVILIVVQPGRGTPTGTTSPPPTSAAPTDGSTPGATDDPADPGDASACDPDKVTVTAVTDENGYDTDADPKLSFTLKSSMTSACTLSAGSDVQEYRITSGDELIWSSKDCQKDPVAATVLLEPGIPKDGSSLTWDRTRSSEDTCDEDRDKVTADGASYHFEVRIGDDLVSNDKQFLLY